MNLRDEPSAAQLHLHRLAATKAPSCGGQDGHGIPLSSASQSPIEKHDVGSQRDAEKNAHDPGHVDHVKPPLWIVQSDGPSLSNWGRCAGGFAMYRRGFGTGISKLKNQVRDSCPEAHCSKVHRTHELCPQKITFGEMSASGVRDKSSCFPRRMTACAVAKKGPSRETGAALGRFGLPGVMGGGPVPKPSNLKTHPSKLRNQVSDNCPEAHCPKVQWRPLGWDDPDTEITGCRNPATCSHQRVDTDTGGNQPPQPLFVSWPHRRQSRGPARLCLLQPPAQRRGRARRC
jgi:hypothetical protein